MYDWIDEKTASELRKGTKGNTALQSWRKGLGTSSTPILFAAASPGLWGSVWLFGGEEGSSWEETYPAHRQKGPVRDSG